MFAFGVCYTLFICFVYLTYISSGTRVDFVNITQNITITEFGSYDGYGLCTINDYIDPMSNIQYYYILLYNGVIESDIFDAATLSEYNNTQNINVTNNLPFIIASYKNNVSIYLNSPISCTNKITNDIINCFVVGVRPSSSSESYSYISCKIFFSSTQQWSDIFNLSGSDQYYHRNSQPNIICFDDGTYFVLWYYELAGHVTTGQSIKYSLIDSNGSIIIFNATYLSEYYGDSNIFMVQSKFRNNDSFLIEYQMCDSMYNICNIIGYIGHYENKSIYYYKNNTQMNANTISYPYTLINPIYLSITNDCCYVTIYTNSYYSSNNASIYINFNYYDGTKVFETDIKIINESFGGNIQLIQLTMLNDAYFMVLYHIGYDIIGNVFYLKQNRFSNGFQLLYLNQYKFTDIGSDFQAYISNKSGNILIAWDYNIFPNNTFNAQIWNVQLQN